MALASICRRITFPPQCLATNLQQVRTTYIVERRYPARLTKPEKKPDLRQKHYVYDTLDNTVPKAPKLMKILLLKYVEDVGKPGEVVSVKEPSARLLIMTQKATYPTPNNLAKYGTVTETKTYSSKHVVTTMNTLQKFVLNVSMNKENPWTLEPWHIRVAFRKARVHVPESAITMPNHTISGPDMNLEGKEFYVTVTINGQEKQVVRCRIHHWATDIEGKLPRVRDHWKFPVETIFIEDKEIAKDLPELVPPVFDEDDDYKPPVRKRSGI